MSPTPTKQRYGSREHSIFKWSPRTPLSDEQYRKQLEARFWAKVDKSPGYGPNGDCWVWTGSLPSRGDHDKYGRYGQLAVRSPIGYRPVRAHILSFFLATGELVYGRSQCVCHTCDNPPCVRPDHLWKGTHSDNLRDAQTKGRFRVAQPDTRPILQRTRFTPKQAFQLRMARQRLGLSIFDIAKAIGIHYSFVSLLETGKRHSMMRKQAQALIDYLKPNFSIEQCEAVEQRRGLRYGKSKYKKAA